MKYKRKLYCDQLFINLDQFYLETLRFPEFKLAHHL